MAVNEAAFGRGLGVGGHSTVAWANRSVGRNKRTVARNFECIMMAKYVMKDPLVREKRQRKGGWDFHSDIWSFVYIYIHFNHINLDVHDYDLRLLVRVYATC